MTGPTWSQWFGATEEANEKHDIAEHNFEAAQKWKRRAMELAQRLDAMQQEVNELTELYKDASGSAAGQRRLKNLAMDALKLVEPGNKALNPKFREEEFDKAKAERMRELGAPAESASSPSPSPG